MARLLHSIEEIYASDCSRGQIHHFSMAFFEGTTTYEIWSKATYASRLLSNPSTAKSMISFVEIRAAGSPSGHCRSVFAIMGNPYDVSPCTGIIWPKTKSIVRIVASYNSESELDPLLSSELLEVSELLKAAQVDDIWTFTQNLKDRKVVVNLIS